MADTEAIRDSSCAGALNVRTKATLLRAAPGIVLLVAAALLPLWGVLEDDWSVLAVAWVYLADGAADGLFAWIRARQARARDDSDHVLVREFVRTYFVIVLSMALVAYMVFSGTLLRPDGEVPEGFAAAFTTWQYWATVAAVVGARAFVYAWDWIAGHEVDFMPPEAVVGEPLKRLFVLQFWVLVFGLIVFWLKDSSATWLTILVAVTAAGDLALALLERTRTARVRAAVEAGLSPAESRDSASGRRARRDPRRRRAPRGGRRRSKS